MSGTDVNPTGAKWSTSGIAWLIARCAETPKRTLGGKLVKSSTK